MKSHLIIYMLTLLAACFMAGCESLDDSISEDPYGGGKQPLGIKLLDDAPDPSTGVPGDIVVFKAEGLLKWCDPAAGTYSFKMFMGGEEAEIQNVTDSTLIVKVPQELSSGITYIVLENQVFYGPTFTVDGNVSLDKDYGLYKDQNLITGTVYDAVERTTKGTYNNFYLIGNISSKVGGRTVNGFGIVDEQGNFITNTSVGFQPNGGILNASKDVFSDLYLKSLSLFANGEILISGAFEGFYYNYGSDPALSKLVGGSYMPTSNIAKLNEIALIDTMQLYFNELTSKTGKQTPLPVSRFNGGFSQPVLRSFITKTGTDQKVIAIGNFSQYITTGYASSYSDNTEDVTPMPNVARVNRDGSLDKTYRYTSDGKKYTGAAGGTVSDGFMDEDGGVVLVGNFTSFDGTPVGGIVRLLPDGDIDRDFLANIKGGMNGAITKIRYDQRTGKAAVTGSFTTAGGHPTPYIAIIDKAGNVDRNFITRGFLGGTPTFAGIVSRQAAKVIVGGTFTSYDGIHRNGFLILDMDGHATQKFNVPGQFQGEIEQVREAETTIGDYGLLLVGDITKFNGLRVNNVVMLQADFE